MTRFRGFLIVLVFLAALPLAAQNPPTDADGPSGDDNCEEACQKANDSIDSAIANLELALAAWEDDPSASAYALGVKSFAANLRKKQSVKCGGRRNFDPDREWLKKLIEKINKEQGAPGPNQMLSAAERWISIAEAWEAVFRRCAEMETIFRKNSQIDFTNDLTTAELRRLLDQETNRTRKNTRDALLRPDGVPCSDENRRILLELIRPDGSLQR